MKFQHEAAIVRNSARRGLCLKSLTLAAIVPMFVLTSCAGGVPDTPGNSAVVAAVQEPQPAEIVKFYEGFPSSGIASPQPGDPESALFVDPAQPHLLSFTSAGNSSCWEEPHQMTVDKNGTLHLTSRQVLADSCEFDISLMTSTFVIPSHVDLEKGVVVDDILTPVYTADLERFSSLDEVKSAYSDAGGACEIWTVSPVEELGDSGSCGNVYLTWIPEGEDLEVALAERLATTYDGTVLVGANWIVYDQDAAEFRVAMHGSVQHIISTNPS